MCSHPSPIQVHFLLTSLRLAGSGVSYIRPNSVPVLTPDVALVFFHGPQQLTGELKNTLKEHAYYSQPLPSAHKHLFTAHVVTSVLLGKIYSTLRTDI